MGPQPRSLHFARDVRSGAYDCATLFPHIDRSLPATAAVTAQAAPEVAP